MGAHRRLWLRSSLVCVSGGQNLQKDVQWEDLGSVGESGRSFSRSRRLPAVSAVRLSQEKGKILSKQKINLLLTKIKKMLKEKSVPQLKELMDLIVNEIIVNDKDVIVYLNIPIVN